MPRSGHLSASRGQREKRENTQGVCMDNRLTANYRALLFWRVNVCVFFFASYRVRLVPKFQGGEKKVECSTRNISR